MCKRYLVSDIRVIEIELTSSVLTQIIPHNCYLSPDSRLIKSSFRVLLLKKYFFLIEGIIRTNLQPCTQTVHQLQCEYPICVIMSICYLSLSSLHTHSCSHTLTASKFVKQTSTLISVSYHGTLLNVVIKR